MMMLVLHGLSCARDTVARRLAMRSLPGAGLGHATAPPAGAQSAPASAASAPSPEAAPRSTSTHRDRPADERPRERLTTRVTGPRTREPPGPDHSDAGEHDAAREQRRLRCPAATA